MLYTTSILETVAECNRVITEVSSKLNDSIFRQATKEAQVAGNNNTAVLLPGQIILLENRIATKQQELAAADDENDQRLLTIEVNNLVNQRLRLLGRMNNFESITVLDREFDLAMLEKEIEALTEYKAAVEARKAELESSANAA